MEGLLGASYLWVKAAHVVFVIFLMAALFLFPRFLIYMHPVAPGSAEEAVWADRCNRLRHIIMTPSLVLVWILGLLLAAHLGLWREGWFHAKFALVFLLSGYHGWIVGLGKKMARGERPLAERRLRLMNEVPGLATILIVVLVIVRPF